jgi:hypothetical protein
VEVDATTNSIIGIVQDVAGVPMRDEAVYLLAGRIHYWGVKKTVTDVNGRFVFRNVQWDRPIVACGSQLECASRPRLGPGDSAQVDLRLDGSRQVHVRGSIVAAKGKLEGRARFWYLTPDRARLVWPPPVVEAKTAEDGSFQTVLLPGRYVVDVIAQRGADRPPLAWLAVVDVGADAAEVTLRAGTGNLSVALKGDGIEKVDPSLVAVPNVVPAAFPSHVTLAAHVPVAGDARAAVGPLEPGVYDLVLQQQTSGPDLPLYGMQAKGGITLKQGVSQVEWVLQPACRLQVDARGAGALGARVVVAGPARTRLQSVHAYLVTPGPTRARAAFPEGDYTVFAFTVGGYFSCEGRRIRLPMKEPLVISPAHAGSLRVVLAGVPEAIRGRSVRLWKSDGAKVIRLYDPLYSYNTHFSTAIVLPTTADGETTIGWLRPGRYTVGVDGSEKRHVVRIRPGQISELRMSVSRGETTIRKAIP